MVGGTAASFMIFFLPGMLLINAAIVKRSNEVAILPVILQIITYLERYLYSFPPPKLTMTSGFLKRP